MRIWRAGPVFLVPERRRNVNYDKSLEKYVKQGAFHRNGMPPSMNQKNIAFVVGWFNKTLPISLKENETPLSFLHVDTDLVVGNDPTVHARLHVNNVYPPTRET